MKFITAHQVASLLVPLSIPTVETVIAPHCRHLVLQNLFHQSTAARASSKPRKMTRRHHLLYMYLRARNENSFLSTILHAAHGCVYMWSLTASRWRRCPTSISKRTVCSRVNSIPARYIRPRPLARTKKAGTHQVARKERLAMWLMCLC
jgi:hypothetical protein